MTSVHYIAAARVADRCRIAQHFVPCANRAAPALFEQKFDKILSSSQLKHNNRLTIVDEHVGHIHYDADAALIFLIVTDASFPQRTAFQVLADARVEFEKLLADHVSKATACSLSKPAHPIFNHVLHEYAQVSNLDKISNVQHQVQHVKGMMHQNIKSALHNTDNLETLLDISDNMKNDAYSFNRSTVEVKQRMQWKNLQMKLLIAFFVLLIVSVIIASIVVRRKAQNA